MSEVKGEARSDEDDGVPAREMEEKKEMRVTGVPSLWDRDENESEKGNEAGKVRERPRGVLVTERDLAVLRWIGEQFAVRSDVIRWPRRRPALERRPDPPGDRPVAPGRTRPSAPLLPRSRASCLADPGRAPVVLDGYRARTPKLSMLAHIHAVSLVRFGLERNGTGKAGCPSGRSTGRGHLPTSTSLTASTPTERPAHRHRGRTDREGGRAAPTHHQRPHTLRIRPRRLRHRRRPGGRGRAGRRPRRRRGRPGRTRGPGRLRPPAGRREPPGRGPPGRTDLRLVRAR